MRVTALLAALLLAACQASPLTGRQQLNVVSNSYAADLGAQAFLDIKKKERISNDPALNAEVQRVGKRIVDAADMKHCEWEFRVFEDPTANAFALPGCKVGVNTGLFKVVRSEDELAAVLGHEVAHVALHHSAERMSQQLLVGIGLTIAGAKADADRAQAIADVATVAVVLPFSRQAESEADTIGLRYLILAGYNPQAAVDVWQNFAKADAGGQKPPEYLSTHPSDQSRIEALSALVKRYRDTGELPR